MEEGVVMTGVVAMAEGTRTTIRMTRDVVVAETLAIFSGGFQAFLLDHQHPEADMVVVVGGPGGYRKTINQNIDINTVCMPVNLAET